MRTLRCDRLRAVRGLTLGFTLTAMLLAGALPAGAGTASPADKPKYGGTFVVAIVNDPTTLNPATSSDFYVKIISGTVFDTLVNLDFNFNPVPRLAKSWDISKDGLTYTFHLANAKWHDGKPVTSEDVKFTVEQVLGPLHPSGGQYKDRIQEIQTPNPQTVVFKLKTPFGPFPVMLANDLYIVPKHVYQGTDILRNPARLTPVGTGPFKFAEWKKGDYVRVVRNPDYFMEGKPYLDEIVFKVASDAGSRMLAFEKGEIDYLSFYMFPASEVERVRKIPGFRTTTKGHEIFGDILDLFFNLDKAPYNNLKVRQAIAHAIDKNYMLDKADYGLGKIATGPIPSSLPWAYTTEVTRYTHDVARANRLLDEAGYPKNDKGIRFKTSLMWDRTVPLFTKTAEILREQLKAVGIDLDIRPSDRPTMLDLVFTKRDFDLWVHGLSTGGDPAIGIQRLYLSGNIRPAPFTNASGYRNPTVDDLFAKAAANPDQKARAQLYHQAQKILTQDLPIIWLLEFSDNSAWRDEFRGVHEWSAMSFYSLGETWWTKGRERP
jgi:peptide/nickel transport system substrate-binding protein